MIDHPVFFFLLDNPVFFLLPTIVIAALCLSLGYRWGSIKASISVRSKMAELERAINNSRQQTEYALKQVDEALAAGRTFERASNNWKEVAARYENAADDWKKVAEGYKRIARAGSGKGEGE